MINIKVEKINTEKAFDRTKIYTPEDITDQVVQPIIDVERLDTTLDTSSLTLINNDENAIAPFTRMVMTFSRDYVGEKKTWERLNDDGTRAKIYIIPQCVWNNNGTTYYSVGNDAEVGFSLGDVDNPATAQLVYDEYAQVWKNITWGGLSEEELKLFSGKYIWQSANGQIYFDREYTDTSVHPYKDIHIHKRLVGNTWTDNTWNGLSENELSVFSGEHIWITNGRTYYSNTVSQQEVDIQKVLDENTNTWSDKTWSYNIDIERENARPFQAYNNDTYWAGTIDGTNISLKYITTTDDWEEYTWHDWRGNVVLTALFNFEVWNDGENVRCGDDLVLNRSTYVWEFDRLKLNAEDDILRTYWQHFYNVGNGVYYGEIIEIKGNEEVYQYQLFPPRERIYRLVYSDTPELLTYGTKRYKHQVELIEPTKWLERFDVDNTTITNFLAFLYANENVIYPLVANYRQDILSNEVSGAWVSSVSYANSRRFMDTVVLGTKINPHIELNVIYGHYNWGILVPFGKKNEEAIFTTATMTLPNGKVTNLRGLSSDGSMYEWKVDRITFGQLGKYIFTWTYQNGGYIWGTTLSWQIRSTYTWEVNVVEAPTEAEKVPQRYNIAQVVDLVLQKAGNEASVLRDGLDSPLFQLDSGIRDKLASITSPEFTFTQSTLFGVLSEIGAAINAIPRLVPQIVPIVDGRQQSGNDYWTYWNTITFDFLGQHDAVVRGDITASEHSTTADNYATDFVTNVQNSFQTNNYDYIALTEPYSDGFVSTRTEDATYEISNDSACIKTSRPIQRIVELIVYAQYKVDGSTIARTRDITQYVKESADYSLLKDYADTTAELSALGTKEMAIYYTRGTNIISGLTYMAPTHLSIETLGLSNAITNILRVETGTTNTFALKDLMFRIKYVPYYNLKLKQYKPYITNNSGNNSLFFNQQNTQMVDIESLGENIKGALLRTANEEITRTEYYHDFEPIIKAGQLTADSYYAYQVNKEITNRRVKATAQFSKDFNKWNEYIAIKKNFREWEISERESIETNPTYSEFCIISTEPDWEKDKPTESDFENTDDYNEALTSYNSGLELYKTRLTEFGGFTSAGAIEQIYGKLSNATDITFTPIDWVVGTTISQEYTGAGEYETVRNTFILPCACFSFGNSVALNFGAQDNYAMATYADTKTVDNNSYAIENYVKYADKYGNAQDLELCFGSGSAKTDGFNTYDNALTSSKEFYSFNESELNESAIVLDYRAHPFNINKDSRQALNMTLQLHFVTEDERIWLGKGFAQMMPFVGNTEVGGLKYAEFSSKPDKFLSTIDTTIWTAVDTPTCEIDSDFKAIKIDSMTIKNDCVGVGIVDSQNRVVLFFDKEYEKGDTTEPLYFEFRRKI